MHGYVHPKFASVAQCFESMLPKGAGGAALCIYHQGSPVVDIWGGTRDHKGTPWEEDTLALSYSTTKGIASTVLHLLADRGLVHYDDPVAKYWPEFAQAGKEQITLRQLLCHEAGLHNISQLIEQAEHLTDWNIMTEALASAEPEFRPGSANGYHGLTYGHLIGEVIQRVTGKTFSENLQELLVEPLALDGLFIGLPREEFHRRALLIDHPADRPKGPDRPAPTLKSRREKLLRMAIWRTLKLAGIDLKRTRDGLAPPGIMNFSFNSEQMVASCVPSANGMFTARSLAMVYNMMANLGTGHTGKRLLKEDTVRAMGTIQNRRLDKVVPIPMHWRLGYHRVFTTGPRTPHAFGHFGFGGSGAWCDPSRQLAVAMTLNSGIGTPFGDSRLARINTAAIRAVDR